MAVCNSGDVYGTLTLVEEVHGIGRKYDKYWRVVCDCGRERTVSQHNIRSGNTTSCGYEPCADRYSTRRLPPGQVAATSIYTNYQRKAQKYGHEFSLTRDEFMAVTSQNCTYCGSEPMNCTKDRNGDGVFIYNGMDRVDSSRGYSFDNVVPCCVICNRAKSNLTLDQFFNWIERLTNHHYRKE